MENTSRRRFIAAGATSAAAFGATAIGIADAGTPATDCATLPSRADLGFLRTQRLVHEERCREMLKRFGYEGYVATSGPNVLYLSNHYPLLARMSDVSGTLAVFPSRSDHPVGLVMGQFSFYYTYQEARIELDNAYYLHTSPREDGSGASDPFMFREVKRDGMPELERRRRQAVAAAGPMHAGESAALRKALVDLVGSRGRIATDDPRVVDLVASLDLPLECVVDEDILRAVRLTKSAAELELMSLASAQNIAAATAAAACLREHGSIGGLRSAFYSEASLRGNRPVFMVIDGVSADHFDVPLEEGQGILIDCVSELHGYHGDYGRTVIMGEGSKDLERAVLAVSEAWQIVREHLRPGMSYSQVRQLGRETLQKLGHDLLVSFNPHSVGLAHTDQPRTSRYRFAPHDDIALVEDMILSVDCPLMDTGLGGTVHFEDLVHISSKGAKPIHDSPHAIIRV